MSSWVTGFQHRYLVSSGDHVALVAQKLTTWEPAHYFCTIIIAMIRNGIGRVLTSALSESDVAVSGPIVYISTFDNQTLVYKSWS